MKILKHTFAICAYKESEYLEECVLSLINQKEKSDIIMATSTPNEYIDRISIKYDIPLYINEGEGGITQDWNFALEHVKTKYVTIAHQDDIYESNYSQKVITAMENRRKPLIAFTDYSELRNGEKIYDIPMLKIKRKMLAPLKGKFFSNSKWMRRRILSLGDPICCPSVCFCLENVERPIFNNKYRSCEDWEAWEKISRLKGSFIYMPESLMAHRIHEESATTAIIKDNARVDENYEMYCKFWPAFIAKFINHFYTKSEKSNDL